MSSGKVFIEIEKEQLHNVRMSVHRLVNHGITMTDLFVVLGERPIEDIKNYFFKTDDSDYSRKCFETPDLLEQIEDKGVSVILAHHRINLTVAVFREEFLSKNDWTKTKNGHIYNKYAVKFSALKYRLANVKGLLKDNSFDKIELFYKRNDPDVRIKKKK